MKSFDGIMEFLAVAETGSFTKAARRLGVSTSHISRQVAALEARLGTRLLARSTRQVALTEPGESFLSRCQALTSDLEEALNDASSEARQLKGRLRVSSLSGSFADQVIAPALADFAALHPDLEIDVDFSARRADLLGEGLDFAIRSGPLSDSALIARPLATRTYVAAASPEYLRTHGAPRHPRELAGHQCLLTHSSRWRFDGPDGPIEVPVSGRWQSNSGASLTAACLNGMGIAYMGCAGFGEALNSGRLTPTLKPFWRRERSIQIVYLDRRYLPARARAAIEFLIDRCKDFEEVPRV